MKFSLLGVFIAIVAATTPYSPPTNQELWNELTSTLPALCAAHGNTLLADRVTDVYPYVGPEPISLPVVHVFRTPPPPRDDVSNAGAASVVMILCGFEARGFVTTDICMLLLRRLCSRQLLSAAASENREFVVFPYVNERGRELIMELWPEMTGQYSRSYSELLAQVPSQYHRVTRLLFTGLGKEQHDLNGILPTVQCFDGSVRMTLLNNNFATGWLPREAMVQTESFDYLTDSEVVTMDRVSTNGRLAFSDPETRIIQAVLQKHLPNILIQVTLGKPAVLAPYDAASLALTQVANLPKAQRANFDASIAQASLFARQHCPASTTCATGMAAQVRTNSEPARAGTVGDYASTLGVSRIYVLQVLANREPAKLLNTARSSNVADCIAPKTFATSDEAVLHAARWCELVEIMAHSPDH